MSKAGKSSRPWREIAAEIVHENDPEKVLTLCQELSLAIEEQVRSCGKAGADRPK